MNGGGGFRRIHLATLAALVAALSLAKGLRMPNAWSATHLTFNYSHGFIRRGLLGELVFLAGGAGRLSYNRLALVSVSLFALTALLTRAWAQRLVAVGWRDLALGLALLAFLASPALVFFIHIIGYLDYLAVLFSVGFVLLAARAPASRRGRTALVAYAVLGGGALALCHEMLTFVFSPVVFFVLLCRGLRERRDGGPGTLGRSWRVALGVWVALLGESALVSVLGTRPPGLVDALKASVAPRVNFPLRGDAFDVLHRGLAENVFHLMPYHWSLPDTYVALFRCSLVSAPAILFALGTGLASLGRRGDLGASMKRLLGGAFGLAALGPHALNFVGWDSERWNALSTWTTMLCLSAVYLVLPTPPTAQPPAAPEASSMPVVAEPAPGWLVAAGAAAVIVGLCANIRLFDGYVVQWFPFEGQLASAVELVRGRFTFIPRY